MNARLNHVLASEWFEAALVMIFVVVSVALLVGMFFHPTLIGLGIIFMGSAPRWVADTEAALKSARKQHTSTSGWNVYPIVTGRTRLRRVVGG